MADKPTHTPRPDFAAAQALGIKTEGRSTAEIMDDLTRMLEAGGRDPIATAARWIKDAEVVILFSGAGMGVDSGFGTFRGKNAGVWLPLKPLDLDFSELSCPAWFKSDPRLGWAFWHFRHQAYTTADPHKGYDIASQWCRAAPKGYFCCTSNIDGHWGRSGMPPEKVWECHGTVTRLQGLEQKSEIFDTDNAAIGAMKVGVYDPQPGEKLEARFEPQGDWEAATVNDDGATLTRASSGKTEKVWGARREGGEDMFRVSESSALPMCPDGKPARPNVMMFMDYDTNMKIIQEQESRYRAFLSSLPLNTKVVCIEIGAGTAIATQRLLCEAAADQFEDGKLIRVNLEQGDLPDEGGIASPSRSVAVTGLGALDALTRIDKAMAEL